MCNCHKEILLKKLEQYRNTTTMKYKGGIGICFSNTSLKLLVAYMGFKRTNSRKPVYLFADDFVEFCCFCGKKYVEQEKNHE